jgi:hypothetical protein
MMLHGGDIFSKCLHDGTSALGRWCWIGFPGIPCHSASTLYTGIEGVCIPMNDYCSFLNYQVLKRA